MKEVYSMVATSANISDVTQSHHLLQGSEQEIFADAGYTGASNRKEHHQTRAAAWNIPRRGFYMLPGENEQLLTQQHLENLKAMAKICSKLEFPCQIIKCLFGFSKVRYKGLARNLAKLLMLFALANLYSARKALLSF